MYPVGIEQILIGVNLLGLILLSYLVIKQKNFLDKLFPKDKNIEEGTIFLRKQFDSLLENLEKVQIGEQQLKKQVIDFRKTSLGYIQKVNTLRYNPYNDTGGEQSFSILLLDGNECGVLITSLHSRAGTRVYTKNIIKGKSDIELSKEEKELLVKTIE